MPVKEIINVGNISTHDKTCIGCKREKKEVLLCISEDNKGKYKDRQYYEIFLNAEQAKYLYETLGRTLTSNALKNKE